jgi:hypothetical protein
MEIVDLNVELVEYTELLEKGVTIRLGNVIYIGTG